MVQDKRIVSIEVQWEVICTLPNGDMAGDLGWPLTPTPPKFLHFVLFFISS